MMELSPAMDESAKTHWKPLKTFFPPGRKLILVTGRHLPELISIFPDLNLFHRVAENGAIAAKRSCFVSRRMSASFKFFRNAEYPLRLAEASLLPGNRTKKHVLSCIRDLGLDLQVIFNKGAVMVPSLWSEQGNRPRRCDKRAWTVETQCSRIGRRGK
jgi:hydroxymethylpyrimidine pyrophosphatase-like HAD family hydrolase